MRGVRELTGVNGERARIKSSASRIIEYILQWPKANPRDIRKDWLRPPSLASFVNLEPLGFGLEQDDWFVLNAEGCSPDIVWPLDVGLAVDMDDITPFNMMRIRSVRPKDARGYASRFSPYMVREDGAQYREEGLLTYAGLAVWLGGKWVDAQKRTMWESRDEDVAIPQKNNIFDMQMHRQITLAIGVALKHRYEWAVSLGLPGTPSIRFATDPTGIKDIFRIRDLPENKDRRDALLTWVSDHWRQNRTDPDIEGYVRRHLRGATKFDWWGMHGEVLPSKYDIETRDKLIAERAAMHIAGTDQRAVS